MGTRELSLKKIVPTHMVEEGFAFVRGDEGVDSREEAKVEREEG